MANKAKFKLLSKHKSDLGTIIYHDIELTDADNDVSKYIVTDYYNSSGLNIEATTIEAVKGDCDVDNEDINTDSYLGKKIMEFIENGCQDFDKYADDPNLEVQINDMSPEDCNEVLSEMVTNMDSNDYLKMCHEHGWISNDAVYVSNAISELEYEECLGAIRVGESIIDGVYELDRIQSVKLN